MKFATKILLASLLTVPVFTSYAEEAVTGADASAPAFFVVNQSTSVSAESLTRIKEFVTKNLAVKLEDLAIEVDAKELRGLINDSVPMIPDRAVGVIMLVDIPDEQGAHRSSVEGQPISFVHVSALLADGDVDKTYFRIERQVMRSMAFLMGFEQSPDPFSVMAPYRTLDELDNRGRNFSPPDTFKFQKQAREKGVSLVENSSFYVAP